jgi:hypothetical protein
MESLLGSLRIRRCIDCGSNLFRTSLSFLCDCPRLLSADGATVVQRRVRGRDVEAGREISYESMRDERRESESKVEEQVMRQSGVNEEMGLTTMINLISS